MPWERPPNEWEVGCVQRICNLMNGTESEQSIEDDIIIKQLREELCILFNFGATVQGGPRDTPSALVATGTQKERERET